MTKYKLPKIEELLESGVHFGHQVKRWHPKMEKYIYGVRNNIHILDLESTLDGLKSVCEFLYETAKRGEQIVFVGTKRQARDIVALEGKRSGALYITERWLGGTVTNFRILRKNIDKLLDLVRRRDSGDLGKYTKKERLMIDREIEKLQRYYGGIVALRGVPGAIFVVDARREKTALKEARIAGVKVAGLVDTNSDPTLLEYVIPGNDDAIKSVAIIMKAVAGAVEEGYKEYQKSFEANTQSAVEKEPNIETSTEKVALEEKKPAKKAKEAKKKK